jgi:Biotin-lipoyl like
MVIVGSHVSGVVEQVNCDYNNIVRRGQLCAKIDPREFQAAIDEAQANLAVSRASCLPAKIANGSKHMNSFQFGRTSAPIPPQFVHAIRDTRVGTRIWPGHLSTLTILS